jgi:hypothetical protein
MGSIEYMIELIFLNAIPAGLIVLGLTLVCRLPSQLRTGASVAAAERGRTHERSTEGRADGRHASLGSRPRRMRTYHQRAGAES